MNTISRNTMINKRIWNKACIIFMLAYLSVHEGRDWHAHFSFSISLKWSATFVWDISLSHIYKWYCLVTISFKITPYLAKELLVQQFRPSNVQGPVSISCTVAMYPGYRVVFTFSQIEGKQNRNNKQRCPSFHIPPPTCSLPHGRHHRSWLPFLEPK